MLSLFFLSLLSLTTAQSLPSGLVIQTTKPASCTRKSQPGDTLSVNYRGTLQSNGKEFDSSYGRAPFSFTLGRGEVIKGWDAGMVDMCIGEGRKLIIPSALAYGDRGTGGIPGKAVLVFETELLGIQGVEAETAPPTVNDKPQPPQDAKHPKDDDKDKENTGECKLLGNFAILIQGALGALALLALVWKRLREKPRRPVKIWFFDVSKQVVGSFMLHFANLFLSMLSSGKLEFDSLAAVEKKPNPCSFYLLNLAIDTTIGIPILVLFLRILHFIALRVPGFSSPPESLKSGNYGHPPQWRWWAKQALVYFLGLFGMKFMVFLIFALFPWLGWVGDWALRWTEGKEWMQIVFVMLVFPLIMNAAQYWIIDSFIKDKKADGEGYGEGERDRDGYGAVGARGEDSDESGDEGDGLLGGEDFDVSHGESRRGGNGGSGKTRTKEANPTPVPVEVDSDEEERRRR